MLPSGCQIQLSRKQIRIVCQDLEEATPAIVIADLRQAHRLPCSDRLFFPCNQYLRL
jgi:hypothetical protein